MRIAGAFTSSVPGGYWDRSRYGCRLQAQGDRIGAHAWQPARLLVPAAVYAVILALSSVPADRLGGLPDWLGTLGHAGGYALLAAALRWALRGTRAATATWVLVAVVVLAGVDELSQARVPGRDPSAGDVAVDLAGGALALVVLRAAGRG